MSAAALPGTSDGGAIHVASAHPRRGDRRRQRDAGHPWTQGAFRAPGDQERRGRGCGNGIGLSRSG